MKILLLEKLLKKGWHKEKLFVLSNFAFCQCFQKSSAAEASESVYMWVRVNLLSDTDDIFKQSIFENLDGKRAKKF